MTDYKSRRITMVDTQVRPSDVTKFPIIDAMLSVPREVFLPDALRDLAYVGAHIDLGRGRVVLDPRVLAKMLDALAVGRGDLVLDIAPNYGYSTAVLAHMAEAVVAVEENPDFAREAEAILAAQSVDNAAVIQGPHIGGAAKTGPYDAILLQGAIETLPQGLADQLKEGGRIAAIFQEGALGEVRIGRKSEGAITWRLAFAANAPVLAGFEQPRAFAL